MFTQNYINGVNGFFANKNFSFVSCAGGAARTGEYATSKVGLGYYMRRGNCRVCETTATSEAGTNSGIYFGAGTTPATKDDYKLENLISSGLTITNPSYFVEVQGGSGTYIWVSDFVVKNTSDKELRVGEIGLFLPFRGSSTYYLTLAERTVLDEPITIPAGATRIIEYKLTFNQIA